MTAETTAALQAINARLGLDSSLGMFGLGGGNPSRAAQSLDGGPRSVSMGALGQRHAFFGGSFGAAANTAASQVSHRCCSRFTQPSSHPCRAEVKQAR